MIETTTIDRDALYQGLAAGVTLITGNNRLAAAIRQAYEQAAIDAGLKVWPTPDILPWSSWVRRSWEEAMVGGGIEPPGHCLTTEQALQIWEDIIGKSPQGHGLLRSSATARMAREARRLLKDWRLDGDVEADRGNEDTAAFDAWSSAFETRCAASGWITEDDLPEQLARVYAGGDMQPPDALWLMGFDEFTPQQGHLLDALKGRGTVQWLQPEACGGRTVRLGCDDTRDEISTMANWARSRLEAKPDARIGIVATDLYTTRGLLAQALDRTLLPEAMMPGAAAASRPYNISLGLPLGGYPIIQSALQMLALAGGRSDMEQIAGLLRSPFFAGWQEEAGARAMLDRQLRKRGAPIVSLKTLIFAAGRQDRPEYSPRLAERLVALQDKVGEGHGSVDTVQWAIRFSDWLKAAGWAQGRSLSSEEYQTVEKWQALLTAFSGLEIVTGGLSRGEALATLGRMAGEQVFQPQTGHPPIQVLGLYEAIGLDFDHLWVMGLDDASWPPAPNPNPFLSHRLQRQLGMPRSSQDRELQVARRITRRLSESAGEVVMSYPGSREAEALRPSPLITSFHAANVDELGLWQGEDWCTGVRASGQMEVITDDEAPPLEQSQAGGGSAIFRLQSLCPFRAFAELRLGARPLEQTQIGLDAMQRGSLVHKVMELFWRSVQTQQALLALSEEALTELIDQKIAAAIDEMARLSPQVFTAPFRAVESERLRMLVLKWLELDRRRAPFRVAGYEQEIHAGVNGLEIHLLIDRIDELEDGRRVVIDYKTGEVRPAQWFGERPDDPQLPLYTTVVGGEVAAVLFGQIRAGDVRFNGVVAEDDIIQGLPPAKNRQLKEVTEHWDAVLEEWHVMVDRLAAEYREGRADVDPKTEATCDNSYCSLSPLCRIDEQRALANSPLREEA